MKAKKLVTKFGILTCCMFLFAACGGGGGGGGAASVTYTGVTTQATLSNTNAETIAMGAYEGGSSSPDLTSFGPYATGVQTTSDPAPAKRESRLLMLRDVVESAIAKTTQPAPTSSTARMQGYIDQQELPPGSCGGSASYSANIDDQTGDYSGTITFNNYCDEGDTINGSMTFSMTTNQSTYEVTTTATVTSFTISGFGESISIGGTISSKTSSGGFPITSTFNMVVKDNGLGTGFWLKDYAIYDNGTTIAILSGSTYYDHNYGYVTVSTTTPILKPVNVWSLPAAGELLLTGANGTARLTFTGTGEGYTVIINTTGVDIQVAP